MKKRADGLYQYQILLGTDENGKRKTKTFYGRTIKEVKQKAEDWKRQNHEAQYSLNTITKSYLASVEDSTLKYRIEAFSDSLGKRNIADINAIDIENVLQELAVNNPTTGKPTSERTLTRYLAAINRVFDYAQRNRMISFNPCEYARVPKAVPPKKREAISLDEIAKIEGTQHKAVLPAMIMIYAGLRRGEVTALRWADVDLERKTITVDKAWDHYKNVLKAPKTASGIRTIPIPQKLVNVLSTARKGKKKGDYVVTNDEGNMMTDGSWLNYQRGLAKHSGVNFTWHMLRHTYATLCYDAGVDAISCSKWCGHSSPRVTIELYTHLSQQKEAASASKLDAFLS